MSSSSKVGDPKYEAGDPGPGSGIRLRGISKAHLESFSTVSAEESSTGLSTDDEDEDNEYDWEREKQRKIQFFDDGTMSYFW